MKINSCRGSAIALVGTAWFSAAPVALAGALGAGCSTACDDAAEHEAECNDEEDVRYGDASCDDVVACASECVIQAPCGAFDGTDEDATATYRACVDAC